jgi:hypothetical protein
MLELTVMKLMNQRGREHNERGLNRDVDSSKFIKSLLTSLFQREDCALFGEEGMVRFNGFN